ncbi:MAG: transcription-repair coupling factor, partial [Bacteroidaceae bacterium]|nr:transcription-repair coupling factor [Bacteroidaceae bacterium]
MMKIEELISIYGAHSEVMALTHAIEDESIRSIFCEGLRASSAPLCFAAIMQKKRKPHPFLIILNDEEEAGYFYHDMVQLCSEENVLYFPSSYRRAVKYAQRDSANEILRTAVLSRLSTWQSEGDSPHEKNLFVVTHPSALAERVASQQQLNQQMLRIAKGDTFDLTELTLRLRELGFSRRDYVYEAGEFAVRGSILDIYSFSSELPFRIDFFGDDVDTLRTYEVETQLSRDRLKEVSIVPDVDAGGSGLVSISK